MNICESAEDYLEAILALREQKGTVRSIDVVHRLGLSKPSVSVAMKRLRENGYIEMDADGFLTLLPPGEEIAQRIYTRHKLLTQFLVRLGVSPEVAAADACKIEHDLSDESFEKIIRHALGGGERDQSTDRRARWARRFFAARRHAGAASRSMGTPASNCRT